MPPEEKVEICFMYLKQGKWKQKTEIIEKNKVYEYEQQYKVLWKRDILC